MAGAFESGDILREPSNSCCLPGKAGGSPVVLEEEKLRSELLEQVEEFGFTPPRADKSKRLLGIFYQFTLTVGLTTEVKDAEVEKIAVVCPEALFKTLFKTVTRYKLADGATVALAGSLSKGAPRNLRMMFSKAVETKETAPRLRVERIGDECTTRRG